MERNIVKRHFSMYSEKSNLSKDEGRGKLNLASTNSVAKSELATNNRSNNG